MIQYLMSTSSSNHYNTPEISNSTVNSNKSSSSNLSKSNLKPLTPSSALFDDSNVTDNTTANIVNNKRLSATNTTKVPRYAVNANTTDCNKDDDADLSLSSDSSDITTNSGKTSLSGRRFSFNKRPVSASKLFRKSSQISIINNYPPQRCDSVDYDIDHSKFYNKYKGILKDKDELPDNALNNLNFEYNYDDKIRAPRMSAVSLISTGNISIINSQKFSRQTSAPALLKSNSHTSSNLESLEEEDNDVKSNNNNNSILSAYNVLNEVNKFQPSSYDLTQKLRKFSLSDTVPNSDEANTESNNLFTNNYTYKLTERKKSIISNSSSAVSPKKEKSKFLNNTTDYDLDKPVKQIDEPSKLFANYVPPVLRPINDSTIKIHNKVEKDYNESTTTTSSVSIDKESKSSIDLLIQSNALPNLRDEPFLNQSKNAVSKIHSQLLNQLNCTISNSSSMISPTISKISVHSGNKSDSSNTSSNQLTLYDDSKSLEPSHSHWKPNNSCNSCENCFTTFNLIKRKHHCRHCGGIYCSNCLKNKANLNLLAHFEKPMSLTMLSMRLNPIKSNDTIESAATIFSSKTLKNHNQNKADKRYTSFCKVCPSCYSDWLIFLQSDEEFEGRHSSNLDDLVEDKTEMSRKESIGGVPTDWNWSSF